MATKKKRTTKRQSISSGRPRSYGEMYKNQTTRQQPVTPAAVGVATAHASTASQSANWRTEYAHVLRDLRILLLISAILFAVIIIAGFFM